MDRIEDAVFVVFDLETSAVLTNGGGRICEIGAIKTSKGKELARFHSMVHPGEPITQGAYRIHKISDGMVRDAPRFSEIGPRFRAFAEGSILVAHNTAFDVKVLNREFSRIGLPRWRAAAIDTVRISRKAFQGLPSYSLDGLASFFDLSFTERHRAIGDCEVTVRVFWKCVERLRAIGLVSSLDDLLRLGRNRAAERGF